MGTIKHFVIIRFYCIDMGLGIDKLFDPDMLEKQADIFENFCLKSLENQTDKNFEIVVMIHDKIDQENAGIHKLKSIKSDIPIHVIRYGGLKQFLNENSMCNYFITTRIDHDDLIYKDAVKDIHESINPNTPLYYNGFTNGITMIDKNYIESCKFYGKYKNGSISIFQSLILNKSFFNDLYNICQLGGHTDQYEKFVDIYKANGLKFDESYFHVSSLEDSFVYIKHNFNHSVMMNPNFDIKWHRSNILVNKPKEWFSERFGIDFETE